VLNAIIGEIWESIWWRRVLIRGKKQYRILPTYRKDRMFKKHLSTLRAGLTLLTGLTRR